jgi:hypothetical protein
MSNKKRALPRGSTVLCVDAMILISYAKADLVALLAAILDRESVFAYTSEWLYQHEIKTPAAKYKDNERILEVDWLKTAPVVDDDIVYVQNLLDAWGSDTGRDRGEAEVVALCTRYGWTGISDDNKAHGVPALQEHHRPFKPTMVHGAALLAAAAAESLITVGEAWTAHQAVEARYEVPPLVPVEDEYEPAFSLAVDLIRKRRDQLGAPNWPILLTQDTDRIVRTVVKKRRQELGG